MENQIIPTTLNAYFDKYYCINLKRRTDRWSESLIQFEKHQLHVDRFDASDGNVFKWKPTAYLAMKSAAFDGNMGCIASHVRIYEEMIKNNYKQVLIIEDDCDFIDNLNTLFEKYIKDIPSDWAFLYFGGVHETVKGKFVPETISDGVVRAKRIITTTCYGITLEGAKKALEIIKPKDKYKYTAIDGYLGVDVQGETDFTYAFHPPLAWQRASFSDIQKGHRDYSEMMKNNNIKQ